MKTLKKILLIGILPVFIFILLIYRQQNIAKRENITTPSQTTDEVCSLDYNPVCGDDNVTYANECAARKNTTTIAHTGICKVEVAQSKTDTGSTNSGTITSASLETTDTYYNNLEAQCDKDACCIGSVHTMRVGGYRLAEGGECGAKEHVNSADCSGSLQWCESGGKTPDSTNGTISPISTNNSQNFDANNVAPLDKRTSYYNNAYNYGFSIPLGDYYSGFGANGDASHTVGINSGTGITTFDEAQIKIYYYKKTPLELQNVSNGFFRDGSKTYLKLSEGSVMIDGNPNSKTVNTIIQTIQNGSGRMISTASGSSL